MNTKLTKTALADLCNIGLDYVSMYLKRGKLIETKDGLIDIENEVNRLFIDKRIETDKDKNNGRSLVELERLIKELEVEKRQLEIELLKIKNQKMAGSVLPVQIFMDLLLQHNKSIGSSFENAAERLITVTAQKYGLKNEDKTALNAQLKVIINDSVKEAVNETKKHAARISKDYYENQ